MCPLNVDQLVVSVEKNHLYAGESLQMRCTATFHYMLQNGVLHTTSLRRSVERVVDSLSNYQAIHVQVSIPLANIIISFVGCGLVVAIGVTVASTHKRGKRIIEANSSITMIAEAMLNPD